MTGKVAGHKGPPPGSFHGRAGGGEWVFGMIVNIFIGAFVGNIPTIGPLLAIPWTIATLAVTNRRLHDLNRSGWIQLAPMAVGAIAAPVIIMAESGNPQLTALPN